jgi:hypothetical protein
MKALLVTFVTLVWFARAMDAAPHIAGAPAPPKDLEVVWVAPTNNWPECLWVYRVVPQQFPEPVVSNLLRIASFAMSDRTNVPPAFADHDKKALFFGILDGNQKHLAICPTLGYVDYHDPKAETDGYFHPVVGVPDQQETTRLGLKYLRMLGIDLSQIATKPGTSDLDLHWERQTTGFTDQKTKEQVNLTNRFTVFFRRRIDGIYVGGIALNGGVVVGFGNHSKVVELQVYWRNLKPYELDACVSPEEITRWLKAGQVTLPPQVGPASQVRKITINQALPYYNSKFGNEPEDFVSPKVDLVVVVDNGQGTKTVIITCPILSPEPAGSSRSAH